MLLGKSRFLETLMFFKGKQFFSLPAVDPLEYVLDGDRPVVILALPSRSFAAPSRGHLLGHQREVAHWQEVLPPCKEVGLAEVLLHVRDLREVLCHVAVLGALALAALVVPGPLAIGAASGRVVRSTNQPRLQGWELDRAVTVNCS